MTWWKLIRPDWELWKITTPKMLRGDNDTIVRIRDGNDVKE